MSTPVLETERLFFRRLALDDLDPLARLYADPEVMRFIGAGGIRSREETRRKLVEMIDAEACQGFGIWATIERATNAFVGRCGLMIWEIEGREEMELLYLLDRAYWGRGLATEAAIAVRDFAFRELSRRRLVSLIYKDNLASARVAEKAGFHREREVSLWECRVDLFSIGNLAGG